LFLSQMHGVGAVFEDYADCDSGSDDCDRVERVDDHVFFATFPRWLLLAEPQPHAAGCAWLRAVGWDAVVGVLGAACPDGDGDA
jgi:hypothetical protein